MTSSEFQPEEILTALHNAGVQSVLIGGFAAIAHGDVARTFDVDVVPDRTLEIQELTDMMTRWILKDPAIA